MPDIKSQTLLEESNKLYEALNEYSNVYVPKIQELLTVFGIDETTVSVTHLDTKSKGSLLKGLAMFLEKIGEEIGERTFEQNIISAGYADVDEAVADIPNRFAGQTAKVIGTNIVKTGETVAVLDASIDNALLEQLLSITINIKNKVAEVTPLMDRV